MDSFLMQSDAYLTVLILVSLALNIVALIQIGNLKYKLRNKKDQEQKTDSI